MIKLFTYILAILLLSSCTIAGRTYQLDEETGEMKLVEKMELRGFGAKEYEKGKKLKKGEPLAIPDIFPSDLIGDILNPKD